MIDNKKELERAELHRTMWNIANDLRGSVDGWDFKQYVLGMLFYRYISENLANYINQGEIFKGLFDDIDVNSNKLGGTVAKRNEKLVKLMDGIADMKLGNYKDNTIDAFGDAYEYLMGMYASNAGKSGGEYYTPQEVSELLTKLTVVGKTEVKGI